MPKTSSATGATLSTAMKSWRSSGCLSVPFEVGYFASNLKQAIKDCEIEDNRDARFFTT